MEPTVSILIGAPLSGAEAEFLRHLHADLQGVEALILANFDTAKRQIDFVAITPTLTALLELKHYWGPLFGEQNGPWMYEAASGQRLRCPGENPWQQTKAAKFALSDEMSAYQSRNVQVPAGGRGFFTQFAAYVCIYPKIHPASRVTRGDYKVRIASYEDVNTVLTSGNLSSTWSIQHWRDFAQRHLNLYEVTLDEATDPTVADASRKLATYRDRLSKVLGASLPPLFSELGNNDSGQPLISQLREPKHFTLCGPSGATKTFHLHHVAIQLTLEGRELPLLIEGKKFRGGDLWALLGHAVAPLITGDPRDLLTAMALCAVKPVLLLDAWNECDEKYRADLLRGVQSFALQFDARVIITTHEPVRLPEDLAAVTITIPSCSALHRRTIYAYHAGVPVTDELNYFSSGFTNAYDLMIAGRCHGSAVGPESRVELYDRYVRYCLPRHTTVATALLREMGARMGSAFSLSATRDSFEGAAEVFLGKHDAPLSVIDDIHSSRLVDMSDDTFSFEHERLLDYFKAEHLRRAVAEVQPLAVELRKPRYQNLIELILPRLSSKSDLDAVISSIDDVDILARILEGRCGSRAQAHVFDICESLLDDAVKDLSHISFECRIDETEEGRRLFTGVILTGHRPWDRSSALVCHVIARHLDNEQLRTKLAELVKLTEWSVGDAVRRAAKIYGLRASRIWSQVLHEYGGVLQRPIVDLPCSSILTDLRLLQMFPRKYKGGLPISAELQHQIQEEADYHFSLLTLMEDYRSEDGFGDVHAAISLAKRAVESKIDILSITGLELLQRISREVRDDAPAELPGIREMLEGINTKNIMLSTALVDALTAYDQLPPPVSEETALAEMRSVIDSTASNQKENLELAFLREVSIEEFLADRAYSLLSNIFEDVFQGVYYQAYEELKEGEKAAILRLAAAKKDTGFFTGWVLTELLKYGDTSSAGIFESYAAGPDGKSFSPQESVEAFILGVQGCSLFEGTITPSDESEAPVSRAWRIAAEILFQTPRVNLNRSELESLWPQLLGTTGLAFGDVLYQLAHAHGLRADRSALVDLPSEFPQELRPVVENCLRNRDAIPSVFEWGGSRDLSVVRYLVDCLGLIGDGDSIPVLVAIADDRTLGRDALAAIEKIRRRSSPPKLAASV